MDTTFELSTDNRFGGLLWRKAQLAKSNEYFHKIHPVGSVEVDERLTAAKVKAELKARAATDAKPSASTVSQTTGSDNSK
jgi:NADH-quinone oxidoreductase subunit I